MEKRKLFKRLSHFSCNDFLLECFALEFEAPVPLNWRQNFRLKLLVHHEHRILVNYRCIPVEINRKYKFKDSHNDLIQFTLRPMLLTHRITLSLLHTKTSATAFSEPFLRSSKALRS